jgi:hypothetical protein
MPVDVVVVREKGTDTDGVLVGRYEGIGLFESVGVDGRILLKRIFKNSGGCGRDVCCVG